MYCVSCYCFCYLIRLGQACNHIAALLFYIHYHASEQKLPEEVSKTSMPMKWHQPPKKTVSPALASGMKFVKPCYGDNIQSCSQSVQRSSFDPRRSYHRQLEPTSVDKLLTHIERTVPNTGLQQFWRDNPKFNNAMMVHADELSLLRNHVIFSHDMVARIVPSKFFVPTISEGYKYLEEISLSFETVQKIEIATRGQSECDLWHSLHNGRLTSSKFGEILHRRPSTDPRRLVRDIMGYGGHMQHVPPQIWWGKENENKARQLYIENRLAVGEVLEVTPSGLHLMVEKPFLGASSDGKVHCSSVDTCCFGCIEMSLQH